MHPIHLTRGSALRSDRTTAVLVGLVATAVVVLWGVSRSPRCAYDDAYITYRYADNLRQGLGLVYNPGEWVLGTTTPLFALLLGSLGLVFPNLEVLGHWLGVISWIIAVWAAIALLRGQGWPRAALAAGLFVALEPTCLPTLGMETHLVVALMLAVAWAWLKGYRALSACLAATLLLTRQDSALWLLLLGIEVWRRKRSLPWREATAAIVLTVPWFLYAGLRYGSILPNSALAKLGQNELMAVGGQGSFPQMLWGQWTAGLNGAVAIVSVAMLALGVWVILRFARALWWLLAWTVVYSVTYTWLGVASFPWYFVPLTIAFCLVMALGSGYLLGDGRVQRPRWEPGSTGHTLLRMIPFVSGVLLLAILVNRGMYMRAAVGDRGYRAAYEQAGQWLASNASRHSSVASIEIGAIGYHSRRPILDTMGLVSPDLARHQVGWAETLAYALNVHSPEYAVGLAGTAWDGIAGRWWFQAQYESAAQFDEVTIFHRRPEPAWLEASFDICYEDGFTVEGIRAKSWTIEPGTALDVRLPLSVQSPPSSRYLFTLFLMDAQTYERPASTTSEPFDGDYGTHHWQTGDRLTLPMRLDLPPDLSPGAYRLVLIVTDLHGAGDLHLIEQPHVPDPEAWIGWFRYGSPVSRPGVAGLDAEPLHVRWQNGIELVSIGLPALPLPPGGVLPVQFTWTADRPIERDLTVFVHLVDDQGQIVAQLDRPPFGGRWPTPVWWEGESLSDTYDIGLDDGPAAGVYGLRFGFYDPDGRLELWDGSADFWFLADAVQIAGQP